MARPENDLGPVPAAFHLKHMALVLRRDTAQQSALDSLSVALQDRHSPLYHRWLQPDEFARRFGVSAGDLDRITRWIREQGFEVDPHTIGPMIVGFSGSASQVEGAFHTSIHFYRASGAIHYSNVGDPRVPRALDGVVGGITGINDFQPRPLVVPHPRVVSQSGQDFMAFTDFEKIYNLLSFNPFSSNPSLLNGAGQTIAVTAPCSVNLAVVQKFWGSLSRSIQTSFYGNVPACDTNSAPEVYLDLEWAGAVAPGAAIVLVASDQGVSDAAYQAVQNQLASIVTTSYTECEEDLGAAGNAFWGALWQQAHLFGITSLVASGDSGAAGCDDPTASVASRGPAVNGLCSSPWSLCVGGTEFNEGSGKYWSSIGTAVGYIPEVAWNESGANGGSGLAAGGGGYSTIYATPSWQSGNPNPMRGVPDLAFSAAAHDGYVFCPENDPSQCGGTTFWYAFGTSAATPAFAGIMATVLQLAGEPQGNPASTLYGLAPREAPIFFHDVVSGNNNVPGQPGYSAGPGWDPVTGLGSVDGGTLALNFAPPAPSISVSPSQIAFGDVAVGSSVSQTITITNTGERATTDGVSTAKEGPDPTVGSINFYPDNVCGSFGLAPGATCKTSVTFKPSQSGTFTANFAVGVNGFSAPLVRLSGSGIHPAATASNQQVSAVAAATMGCVAPTAVSTFPAGATVYLFFNIVVSAGDKLTSDWLAPDGTVVPGASWNPGTGAGCQTASLNLATLNPVPLGGWLARIYDNSVLLFTVPFSVTASPANGPSIYNWGVVSAANAGTTISPGSLFVVYGSNLASATSSGFGFPLPQTWSGTSVSINGVPAALLYVSPTQINAQAPSAIPLSPGSSIKVYGGSPTSGLANVTVAANGFSISGQVYFSGSAPGVFVDATGHATATHADGSLVNRSSPAHAGEEIVAYGTGPGQLTVTPATGYPAGSGPDLSVCMSGALPDSSPGVFIGGTAAIVDFCGLTPGLAGLMQFNFKIPPGLGPGDVQFALSLGYAGSPLALLTVSPQ